MNLRVKSTQHIWTNIDSGLACLLLELFPANLERVNPDTIAQGQRDLPGAGPSQRAGNRPAPPKTTLYEIVTSMDGYMRPMVKITRPSGEIAMYGGSPQNVPAEVPVEIHARYAQMRGVEQ